MSKRETILEHLTRRGVSRRSFLKFCAVSSSMLALPAGSAKVMAQVLGSSPRPTVIWLSFQECTGCTESITRSFTPTVENVILDVVSLDYQHTLQVAAGAQAEAARVQAMNGAFGQYVLVVDGATPTGGKEWWSTIAGESNLKILQEGVEGAALVIALGTCAAFGGLPAAAPNPTEACSVEQLMNDGLIPTRPLVNISGCPPVPEVITGSIVYYLTYGWNARADGLGLSQNLDVNRRPLPFYGRTVHDTCPRLPHFQAGRFASRFDDPNTRRGWCLAALGCRGPSTHNACSAIGWNGGVSFPMHSGHGCLGCAEPNFWDQGGFYG